MNLRIEKIFEQEMKGDTSFQEKDTFSIFGNKGYSKMEMRETWDSGIKLGIEIGLRKATIEGQVIELNNNTKDKNHKEFLDKFYKLAEEYNCYIQHHHEIGMVVVDRRRN